MWEGACSMLLECEYIVPAGYASLLLTMTCCSWFCELFCSLWFFNDDVWVQSAANRFLPLLMVFYAWTTDIACSTTVIWFWCSYRTYLQWFWLHIREEPVFLANNTFQFQFLKMPCSFVEFVKRCDVFEAFLLQLCNFEKELMSRFDFNTFDDFQFGCCISCNFCPMRMNSFFFCVFRLKEAENQSTSRQNITSTTLCLVGWVKRTLSVALDFLVKLCLSFCCFLEHRSYRLRRFLGIQGIVR